MDALEIKIFYRGVEQVATILYRIMLEYQLAYRIEEVVDLLGYCIVIDFNYISSYTR